MTLRVGRIPYLHCDPFYFDMTRRGIELCAMVPSDLASAAENEVIDAGPLPLVDCFRLEDRFQPVAGFCVASRKHVGSMLLFSTKPIQELHGAPLGITNEAATAVKLLHVLLRLKYQVQPAAYVALDAPHDAFLLIGNQGLRRRLGVPGFPHTYDLGAEWQAWTGLPFVLSRWMVRRDVDPKDKALLQDTLYVGLEEGVNALYAIAQPREDLLMLPRDIVAYIQGFRYYIGMAEQRAIDRFRQYLSAIDGSLT
jgi:chorismate dehydratase